MLTEEARKSPFGVAMTPEATGGLTSWAQVCLNFWKFQVEVVFCFWFVCLFLLALTLSESLRKLPILSSSDISE